MVLLKNPSVHYSMKKKKRQQNPFYCLNSLKTVGTDICKVFWEQRPNTDRKTSSIRNVYRGKETSVFTRSLELSDSLRNKLGKPGIFIPFLIFWAWQLSRTQKTWVAFVVVVAVVGSAVTMTTGKVEAQYLKSWKRGSFMVPLPFIQKASLLFPS